MRLWRRAADRVHEGIDVIALPEGVEGREGHADLGPERAEDELPAPGRVDGLYELGVLPGVDCGAVERRAVLEQFGELRNGRLLLAGCDVDGRVDDRHSERSGRLHGRDDVLAQ